MLAEQLQKLGSMGTLYLIFGLQGGGKSTWVNENAARLGINSLFLDGPLPSRRHRKRAIGLAGEVDCKNVAVWINTPLEVALERNSKRIGLARIKEEAIRHVLENHESPSIEEGFAEVIEVRPKTFEAKADSK
jgi:predicted kinase